MTINRTLYLLKLVLLPTGLAVAGAMAALTALGDAPVADAAPVVEVNSSNVTPVAFRELADRVLSDFDANESLSDSAPQQQVVAAWATKDFGYLLVSQGDETNDALRTLNHNVAALLDVQPALVKAAAIMSPADDRVPITIMWAVLALCWLGIWSVVPRRQQPAATITTPTSSSTSTPLPTEPTNSATAPNPAWALPPDVTDTRQ